MPEFLAEELAEWSRGQWSPRLPEKLNGVTSDSRILRKNNLYFALKGPRFDGHDFIKEAFDKGASGAVVAEEREKEIRNCVLAFENRAILVVKEPAEALKDIARGYRLKVNPAIIGITGSVGKSTVKEMTAQMISLCMTTTRTKGNWNNEIGLPLSMLEMEESCRVGVFELGTNHPGEMDRLCDVLRPLCGMITNIGCAHMGSFGSLEAIAEEKACILKHLPCQGTAVLNKDCVFFDMFRSLCRCRVITVSARSDADYKCIEVNKAGNRAVIHEKESGEKFVLNLRLPGEHNVMNAMFAIAAVRGEGIGWENIGNGIKNYKSLPMRWEEMEVKGIKIINDAYNSNPLSVKAAIKTLMSISQEKRKWLVLGGMLELGHMEKQEHIAIGQFAAEQCPAGLITVGKLGDLIAQGAEDGGLDHNRIFRCYDKYEATSMIMRNVAEGDVILFKGSRGVKLEEIIEETRQQCGDMK